MVILNKKEMQAIKDFVNTHYPVGGVKVGIEVQSEYNDETYDNFLAYIAVYDKDGKEIPPKNGKEVRARMRAVGGDLIPYSTDNFFEDFEITL